MLFKVDLSGCLSQKLFSDKLSLSKLLHFKNLNISFKTAPGVTESIKESVTFKIGKNMYPNNPDEISNINIIIPINGFICLKALDAE